MKKSKFSLKTFAFSLAMAAGLLMSLPIQGQNLGTDGFFSGGFGYYENRDEDDVNISSGITNESFNAPLGSGLLIMMAAGFGYAIKQLKN